MPRLAFALAGAALLSAPVLAKPRLAPEAELAEALRDRIAGAPLSCINLSNVRSTRIIDRTAILYDAGSVVYVNRPASGGRQLDRWDVLVTRLTTHQLCRPDIVRLYDSGSRFMTGSLALGDFVPYRRVRQSRR